MTNQRLTTDGDAADLPAASNVKFPRLRKKLLAMFDQDQQEVRSFAKSYSKTKNETTKKHKWTLMMEKHHARATDMLRILDEIKEPTTENIGLDGSKAVSIIALHSHIGTMKKILNIFEKQYKNNPSNIYCQAIPSLKDKTLTLERKKQLFGTQWWMDTKDGRPYLFPVKDFSKMNQRRSIYELEPAKRLVDLAPGAVKHPLGKGLVRETDQKQPPQDVYDEYSEHHLKERFS